MTLSLSHLLDARQLTAADSHFIMDTAENYILRNRSLDKKHAILKGKTVINLFFENSTRTRGSFELAGKRLGADVINLSASHSSVKKGETLIDTAKTLNAMKPDYVIIRHPESGAAELLAKHVNASVINAGDGMHQHPTQALLDALTIRNHFGSIEGLTVAICGDVAHSRVARSNMVLLHTLGAKVRVIAPATLTPRFLEEVYPVKVYHDMREGLEGVDVVMMLRLQLERMEGSYLPSVREYFHFYGLDRDKLSHAVDNVLVMHPGPMNRGVEISGEIADDVERSVILEQVEMGVAVRQAILELLPGRSDG